MPRRRAPSPYAPVAVGRDVWPPGLPARAAAPLPVAARHRGARLGILLHCRTPSFWRGNAAPSAAGPPGRAIGCRASRSRPSLANNPTQRKQASKRNRRLDACFSRPTCALQTQCRTDGIDLVKLLPREKPATEMPAVGRLPIAPALRLLERKRLDDHAGTEIEQTAIAN